MNEGCCTSTDPSGSDPKFDLQGIITFNVMILFFSLNFTGIHLFYVVWGFFSPANINLKLIPDCHNVIDASLNRFGIMQPCDDEQRFFFQLEEENMTLLSH